MKIAILAHTLYPICEPYAGGMEMITHLLTKKLVARGHEVDLYAAEGSDPDLRVIPYINNRPEAASRNDEVAGFNERYECYQLSAALTHIAQRGYDIVHNHTQHYLPILMGEELEVPFVTTFHTPAFEFLRYAFHFLPAVPQQKFTCVSRSLSGMYAQHNIQSDTIYNGIDLSAWTFKKEVSEEALLWFGRICPEKGTREAIKIARKMNKKLYLAGPISNRDYYEQFIKEELDESQIIYLGHLEHVALNDLIGSCQASLFLSTWEEPYGLAIAESLACGTPVISWDKGASSELLTADCGVIVPENNFEALELAIQKAISLNRNDCRARAEEFCGIDIMVSGYERLYQDMRKADTVGENLTFI